MVLHSNILAQKIPRQKSLAGYSPWGRKELDMTQQLNNNKNFTRWFDRKQQNSVKQLSVNKKYILKKISKNITYNKKGEKKKRLYQMGFLWWSRGEESTCQCREHGFNPWSRKIPHAVEQLSPCATMLSPSATTREAAATRSLHTSTKSSFCWLQLEKAHAQRQRPSAAQ